MEAVGRSALEVLRAKHVRADLPGAWMQLTWVPSAVVVGPMRRVATGLLGLAALGRVRRFGRRRHSRRSPHRRTRGGHDGAWGGVRVTEGVRRVLLRLRLCVWHGVHGGLVQFR